MESGRTAVFPVRYGDVTAGALLILGDVAPRETLPGYERTAANLGWELVGARDPASAERPEGRRLLLAEITALLNQEERVESILARILELTGRAIPFDYIEFAERRGPHAYELLLSAPTSDPPTITSRATDADMEMIHAAGLQVAQYRPGEIPGPGARAFANRGMGRAMTGLVEHNGEVLGLFTLGKEGEAPFENGEVAFLEILCNLVGAAISSQRQLERMALAAERDVLLNRMGLLVSAGEPVDRIMDPFLRSWAA